MLVNQINVLQTNSINYLVLARIPFCDEISALLSTCYKETAFNPLPNAFI